jgi:hypothetical protein
MEENRTCHNCQSPSCLPPIRSMCGSMLLHPPRPRAGAMGVRLHGRMGHGSTARVALACALLVAAPRAAHTGTLFGLQYQGDDAELYALPTVDPLAPNSKVAGATGQPFDYNSSQPIAIGSTGLRRFRRVGAPPMGRDGAVDGEQRSTNMYYNFVPTLSSGVGTASAAGTVQIDAQTGDVVVEEVTIGPLLAVQFSDKGEMFGLLPASSGGTSGGVQVKYFQDLEFGTGTAAVQRRWEERARLSFPGKHAVFGLSAIDRAGEVFYCIGARQPLTLPHTHCVH